MKWFTKEEATTIQRKFNEMCKQFAEENGIEMSKGHLTYGEELVFKTTFVVAENKNEAWNNMVRYFAENGKVLHAGDSFYSGRTRFMVTGTLNPTTRSKYKIGAKNMKTGRTSYFTIDGMMEVL